MKDEEPPDDLVAASFGDRWRELEATEQFLAYVQGGVGELNAAFAVDWTPAELRRRKRDSGFQQLIEIARERRVETIEQRVYELASRKNPARWAVELALFCQAADRGWRPPAQRIDVSRTSKVEVSLVQSTVAAARELMMTADPAALQPGGALDIVDAEVIDGD
jgi:hypothetical protein